MREREYMSNPRPEGPDVSIVVPVKDERDTLAPLYEKIRDTLDPLG